MKRRSVNNQICEIKSEAKRYYVSMFGHQTTISQHPWHLSFILKFIVRSLVLSESCTQFKICIIISIKYNGFVLVCCTMSQRWRENGSFSGDYFHIGVYHSWKISIKLLHLNFRFLSNVTTVCLRSQAPVRMCVCRERERERGGERMSTYFYLIYFVH